MLDRLQPVTLVAVTMLLVALAIAMLIPFLWMISTSLKPAEEIFSFAPDFIPSRIVWQNYLEALRRAPFGLYMFNSVKVSVLAVGGSLFVCSLAGYGFARLPFPGSNALFGILLAAMMIPYTVQLIPLYIIYRKMGWLDTHLPLIVPPIVAHSFGTFLMRQFFMTIPQDLEDAARIDGCSAFRIYWQIELPLVRPALAALGIFIFLGTWNNFLGPLIYITTDAKQTLPVGLALFRGELFTEWHLLMAASMIALLPIFVVYVVAQRHIVEGITLTGLKS